MSESLQGEELALVVASLATFLSSAVVAFRYGGSLWGVIENSKYAGRIFAGFLLVFFWCIFIAVYVLASNSIYGEQ